MDGFDPKPLKATFAELAGLSLVPKPPRKRKREPCKECVKKDATISELRRKVAQRYASACYWKTEAKKLRLALDGPPQWQAKLERQRAVRQASIKRRVDLGRCLRCGNEKEESRRGKKGLQCATRALGPDASDWYALAPISAAIAHTASNGKSGAQAPERRD